MGSEMCIRDRAYTLTILYDKCGRILEDIIHLGNLVTIRVDEVILVNFNKHSFTFLLFSMINVEGNWRT